MDPAPGLEYLAFIFQSTLAGSFITIESVVIFCLARYIVKPDSVASNISADYVPLKGPSAKLTVIRHYLLKTLILSGNVG